MNRRELLTKVSLGFLAALCTTSNADTSADVRARIKVVRRPGWDKQCLACIPGELFGTSDAIPIKLCDTIELSFENNGKHSSVPAGIYLAHVRTDKTKNWMDDLTAWRLELEHVPDHRTNIQFHYGKDAKWSTGCILLGLQSAPLCAGDCTFNDSPRIAVQQVKDYVTPRLLKSDDRVLVEIM
jgi:Family of unknown function (DUF5675)